MRKGLILLSLLAVFLLGIFAFRAYVKEPLYHSQSYVFGTLVDVSIYGESEARAREVTNQVFQEFQNLHNRFHAWKQISESEPSELGQLNNAFKLGKNPITISPDLSFILTDATSLSVKSNGLFNPAIGYLISTWGFQRDEFSAVNVDDNVIKRLVESKPKMTDIVIKNNTAYSTNQMVKLDLGGYAKGYALDIAAAHLRNAHINNALVNIGGNIIAIGQHGNQAWRIGIQDPRRPSAIATLDLPDGWAVGTSGDYQRYFILDGKRYCHIIDPRNGYPAQHTQSVTILVPPQGKNKTQAGVLSDVASKPIFIETPENRSKAAEAFGIDNFMVIDDKSNIFVSKKMVKKINWLTRDVKFTTLP